jgi:NAD(P)-dependent dehydrogenase (short-subunit alcohol dehydrogenase family)
MTKILIIEDDAISKKIWEQYLRYYIPEVEIIWNQSIDPYFEHTESISELANEYDLIICDIFLAGDKTGIDLLEKMPESLQKKTLLSSTVREADYLAYAVKMNLKCYFVQKPIDKTRVAEVLETIFGEQNRPAQNLRDPAFASKSFYQLLRLLPSSTKTTSVVKNASIVRPVIMVTGCHSEIGELLCDKLLTYSNYRIAITAPVEHLQDLRKRFGEQPRALILPLDMAHENEVKDAVAMVLKKWNRIDIIVNNSSICYRAVAEHMDSKTDLKQLQVNYLGPMTLIRCALPIMRENGRGKVINISSVPSVHGLPTLGSYSSSKYALEGSSESLYFELLPLGINVSVVRAEHVHSDTQKPVVTSQKAFLAENLIGPYSDYYKYIRPFLKRFASFTKDTNETLCDKIIQVIQTQNPPLWVSSTFAVSFFSFLRRVLPCRWYHGLMNNFFAVKMILGRSYSKAQARRLRV